MSARFCIDCGLPAESPMLPLCMAHDLKRLARGETAQDIRNREAELMRLREPGSKREPGR